MFTGRDETAVSERAPVSVVDNRDMSYSSPGSLSMSATAEIPRGEVIGRFDTYAQAQKAVDHLADQQFDVAKISIIGSDLKSVERVTGRLSYPKVALQGALNGVVFGAFFGLLMSMLGGADLASSLLLPILMGGAFWMLMAIITYAMQRGKRDFTSVNRIVATSYEVIAAPEVAGQARQVLGGSALRPAEAHTSAPMGAPGPQGGAWQQPPFGAQAPQGTPPRQGAPAQHDGAGDSPAQEPRPANPGRSAKFPDLPDGRPQYGIRLAPQLLPDNVKPAHRPNTAQPDAPAQQPGATSGGSSASQASAPWSGAQTQDKDQDSQDTRGGGN